MALTTQASSPFDAAQSDESSTDMTTILSQETLIKVQHSYKRLVRDQRQKIKQVKTICIYGTPHAFDPDEVIFELEMTNNTPCYDLIGE